MKHSVNLKITHPTPDDAGSAAVNVSDFQAWFGDAHILDSVTVAFREFQINCIVGPSGSGKSTLIRGINRMNDDVEGFKCQGEIHITGRNILARAENTATLRKAVGMVFQKPVVFPKSIAENVLFGIRHARKMSRREKLQIVEENLKSVSLWKEVRHRLHEKAGSLSIGQQQRLCIARTLAVKPSVILLDEPTSSLDPVSARAIEDLMIDLKKDYTIIFVTHNIQQARRIADQLIFMCNGKIIEQGTKEKLFQHPEKEQTRKYLNEEYCDC